MPQTTTDLNLPLYTLYKHSAQKLKMDRMEISESTSSIPNQLIHSALRDESEMIFIMHCAYGSVSPMPRKFFLSPERRL